ncbi:hypothetical protein GCM10027345_08050 [Hymenobacter daeguensis]
MAPTGQVQRQQGANQAGPHYGERFGGGSGRGGGKHKQGELGVERRNYYPASVQPDKAIVQWD